MVGLGILAVHGAARSSAAAELAATILGVLWGVTLTGYLLVLWPLAYFTHFVLEWLDQE